MISRALLFATALSSLTTVGLRAAPILAPPVAELGTTVKAYVRTPAGRIALSHARLIDGTGAPAQDDRTILINGATIEAVLPGSAAIPKGVKVIDLTGETV